MDFETNGGASSCPRENERDEHDEHDEHDKRDEREKSYSERGQDVSDKLLGLRMGPQMRETKKFEYNVPVKTRG